MDQLDVFLSGEKIDLCIPTEDFALKSDWYSWFNDPELTKYLEQGIYPNTRQNQVEFFKSVSNESRLTLIVSNRREYLGVISLSSIDRTKNRCEIAIVINNKLDVFNSSFIALESIALLTTHAFDLLGMERIDAGQHIGLRNWQQMMEVLGYRLEGLQRGRFVKGHERSDVLMIACTYEDYKSITQHRGKLWDSRKDMLRRIRKLPKEPFSAQLRSVLDKGDDYYSSIFYS